MLGSCAVSDPSTAFLRSLYPFNYTLYFGGDSREKNYSQVPSPFSSLRQPLVRCLFHLSGFVVLRLFSPCCLPVYLVLRASLSPGFCHCASAADPTPPSCTEEQEPQIATVCSSQQTQKSLWGQGIVYGLRLRCPSTLCNSFPRWGKSRHFSLTLHIHSILKMNMVLPIFKASLIFLM